MPENVLLQMKNETMSAYEERAAGFEQKPASHWSGLAWALQQDSHVFLLNIFNNVNLLKDCSIKNFFLNPPQLNLDSFLIRFSPNKFSMNQSYSVQVLQHLQA